jgi:hypothetical protein
MQEDTDDREMISITPFSFNRANVKLERPIERPLERACYFHQIGYELRFLREYEKEHVPNIEKIMGDLWHKCGRLESLKNILSRVLMKSFRLLNRAMKTEARSHNRALTDAFSHI